MPESGYLIHKHDVPLLHGSLRAYRSGSRNLPPSQRGKQPPPNRPPIVAVLLEDLISGGTANAAVLYLEESNETQLVSLEGEVTGGSFQLRFHPKGDAALETTGDIPHNASAKTVQTALEALASINTGDVEVSLGHPLGRWLVTFTGQYADQDIPLMQATNGLSSPFGAVVVAATTFWEDSKRTEQVRSLIPVGHPTPLIAGAMVVALWFPRIGYGVTSAECRDFDTDPPDPYSY